MYIKTVNGAENGLDYIILELTFRSS